MKYFIEAGILTRLPNEKYSQCVNHVTETVEKAAIDNDSIALSVSRLRQNASLLELVKTNSREHELSKVITAKSNERYNLFCKIKHATKSFLYSEKPSEKDAAEALNGRFQLYNRMLRSSRIHDFTKAIANIKNESESNSSFKAGMTDIGLAGDLEKLYTLNAIVDKKWLQRGLERKKDLDRVKIIRNDVYQIVKSMVYGLMMLAEQEDASQSVYKDLAKSVNDVFTIYLTQQDTRVAAKRRKAEKEKEPEGTDTPQDAGMDTPTEPQLPESVPVVQ